jgi:hypothetical protein
MRNGQWGADIVPVPYRYRTGTLVNSAKFKFSQRAQNLIRVLWTFADDNEKLGRNQKYRSHLATYAVCQI